MPDVAKLVRIGVLLPAPPPPLTKPRAIAAAAKGSKESGLWLPPRLKPFVDLPPTPSPVASGLRYFWCNTDRTRKKELGGRDEDGGYRLERLMRENSCAGAWVDFKYPKAMAEVNDGDLIFMYANKIGIIAVGRATGGCKVFKSGDPNRIDGDDWDGDEWRVPVVWLRWQQDKSYKWPKPLRPAFVNISASKYQNRRLAALKHFGL
jgi:hypothetical protein